MAPSSRKRQKQTRLAFTPLPSSSPASSSYNKQIRDRAAAVGYEGSPSPAKRRKVRDASGVASSLRVATEADGNKDTSMQPTPEATNRTPDPTELVNNGDDSDPVKLSQSQRMSSRKRMKQKRLDFDSSPPPSTSKRSLGVTSPLKARASRSSQPTPKAGFFGTQKTIPIDSSDDEEELSLPERPSRNKRRGSLSSQDEIFEYAKPASDKDDQKDEDEDEEEEEDVMPTTPAARRRRNVTEPGPDDEPARDSSPFIAEDDEDSDDVVVTGSRTRGKRKAVSRSPDEDSPVEAPKSRKRLRRALNPITEEEQQDLEDDLRDLASSGSETEVRPSQKKKKNPRQEALERLKHKRRGAPLETTEDENEHSQQDEGVEEEAGNNIVISDGEAVGTLLTPKAARRNMFSRDEDDEGFVIDDVEEEGDDGPLGVPENIPIAFTRYASMKAKDLFKFAIDWMVQKKINPAFQIDDEIYDLAFKKLDDEVKGLAGSKFTSSAWTPEFTFSLEARPEIESGRIDRGAAEHFLRDKCDACNRSGHPATYEVLFQGTPYHPVTLEPIATVRDDSDSDSESSSDSEENEGAQNRDFKGRQIASADKVFYLGKHCFGNAQIAHSLSHWRFHLFEWVVDYLNQAGYNAPAKIVKRDSWSTRKRRKYANKIVDAMQTDGKIKALYHDFKNEIDSARNSKQGRFDSSP
ncbi:hypothetical protein BDV97DRAFT_358977 [Delphinella strobiligena]|nr:hypothetical protein BDV97DRAFT_358977 [Delphinella strobiligena]